MLAFHIFTEGKVQNVCFRNFTETVANLLDLNGTAENMKDGKRVEIFVEGESRQLELFIASLKYGPLNSRVDDLSIEPVDAIGMDGFTIIYPPAPVTKFGKGAFPEWTTPSLPGVFKAEANIISLDICELCQQEKAEILQPVRDGDGLIYVCKGCRQMLGCAY
jgi:acylphosphatase